MMRDELDGVEVDVAIVGGGVAGCSVAYHLTKLGMTNVALFERKQLTSGTTWHAAGLVTQLRATRNMTEMAKYSADLFKTLEEETGQATGYKQNGAVRLAKSAGRLEELKRGVSMARNFGLESHEISLDEIKERWSPVNLDGVIGGTWMPSDGQINPADVTMAMAKGARMRGAKIYENTKVDRIVVENGRVTGVLTEKGMVKAKKVAICGGMWSRDLAAAIGATLPLHAAEHFYIVTEAIPDLPRELPVMFCYDEWAYYKEDAGKILLGAFEPVAKPWGHKGISPDFCFDSLPEDFDHFEPILEMATNRVPVLAEAGIQLFFNGPESFTPDDRYLLGAMPEIEGMFCACGFNSVGILSSGGVGKSLADWIVGEAAPMDLIDVDVSRMQPFQGNGQYLFDRTTETLGLLFDMHWPHRQFKTARNLRRSTLHDRLIGKGARMTEMAAYERPGFFVRGDEPQEWTYSFGHQSWFASVHRECLNTQSNVSVTDQSCYTKFMVEGADASKVLNRICAGNVDVACGRLVYTQWLNAKGGIEADVTITRLSETKYMVVSIVAAQTRDLFWLQRHIPDDARCIAYDVTSGTAMLSVQGPKSRELLERLSKEDLSNENFPFASSREIEIGYATVRASRITYVGELGWELYIPTEMAQYVYDKLMEVGTDLGIDDSGFFALQSMRSEKAYRGWGHDIGPDDTPLEAGLKFAVRMDKPGGFIGQEALAKQLAAGPLTKRLVQFQIDEPDVLMHHEEPVYMNSKIVGSIASGNYGHRLGKAVGMGYIHHPDGVTADFVKSGEFEVEIACRRVKAKAQLGPWYDPKGERIKV